MTKVPVRRPDRPGIIGVDQRRLLCGRGRAVAGARRYRVEHRDGERVAALGTVEGGFAHFTALDPFLTGLPAGSADVVVLVDEATEAVVARRHRGRPSRHRPGWRGPVVARRP